MSAVVGEPSPLHPSPSPSGLRRHLADVEQLLADTLTGVRRSFPVAGGCRAVPAAGIDVDLVDIVADLVERGGKRIRPRLVYLGWLGARDESAGPDLADVVRASAAVELLHTCGLIHDDVMDESATRRGADSAHVAVAKHHRDEGGRGCSARFGENVAVLAGDLALHCAEELAGELPAAMRRVWRALVVELVAGQHADLIGSAAADRRLSVARDAARRKSGGYTVTQPLLLGAAAADASDPVRAAYAGYGRYAGEAFALRDELIGLCGDPSTTGKPVGDDLRSGKPTIVLALAARRLHGPARAVIDDVGSSRLTVEKLLLLTAALHDQGVVAEARRRLDSLCRAALTCLAPVAPTVAEQLADFVDRLRTEQ